MQGLELSKSYFEEFGRPMLERDFGEYLDRIAIGLVGHGSECFGYDDEISTDHDFTPGFCLWITEEDDSIFGFRLFRAYSKLPKEYLGFGSSEKSLGGKSAVGVRTISDFYNEYTGRRGAPECARDWLYTPSHYLAEATNGEVFADPLGEFTKVRMQILEGMPEDVRRKKLASCALHMAQSGQYNYKRCLAHEEAASARLALDEFVRNAAEAIFLLERRHMPYYKWCFRAMRALPHLGVMADKLETLLLTPPDETLRIELLIEEVCHDLIAEFRKQGITKATCEYMESHAYSLNDGIADPEIRNLHIYYNTP